MNSPVHKKVARDAEKDDRIDEKEAEVVVEDVVDAVKGASSRAHVAIRSSRRCNSGFLRHAIASVTRVPKMIMSPNGTLRNVSESAMLSMCLSKDP